MYCFWESSLHQLPGVTYSLKIEFKYFLNVSISVDHTACCLGVWTCKMETLVCSLELRDCDLETLWLKEMWEKIQIARHFLITVRRKPGQTVWWGDTCDRCLPYFCKAADNSEKSGSGDKLTFGTGTHLAVKPSKSERKVRSLCLFLWCVVAWCLTCLVLDSRFTNHSIFHVPLNICD